MAFRLATTAQNAACDAIVDLIDSGSTVAAGSIVIFSSPTTPAQPANPQTAAQSTDVPLVRIVFNNPAFGSSSSGTASLVVSPAVTATVLNTGTAYWFRVYNRSYAGNTTGSNVVSGGFSVTGAVFDGLITATGGGGDMTFDNTSFVASGTATISSMSITVPM
jgi:hypothetical protein